MYLYIIRASFNITIQIAASTKYYMDRLIIYLYVEASRTGVLSYIFGVLNHLPIEVSLYIELIKIIIK